MTKIQKLSIASALHNLKITPLAGLPSDQARQVFQHLLSDANLAALRASPLYATVDFDDQNVLPMLCRFPALHALLAQATDITPEKLSFPLALAFLHKLGAAVWRHEAPTLAYPTVTLDSATRQRFKDGFKTYQPLYKGDYPLSASAFALIANLIDAYQIRAFQKLELGALTLSHQDPLDILKNQPRVSSRIIQEIQRFLRKSFGTTSPSLIYAALVHGYAAARDGGGEEQLVYSTSVASLVKDYLLTGVRPHKRADTPWTALKVSVYEDINVLSDDAPPQVSADDLLKSETINYSHFRLHPFTPANIDTLDDFLDQLDDLPLLYKQDMQKYWAAVTPDAGAKKIWANQLKHAIETDARIRLSDSTLQLNSYTLINRVLSQASAQALNDGNSASSLYLYQCSFVDLASGKAFPINGTLLIEQPQAAPASPTLVAYSLDTGALEYNSWEVFKAHVLAQFADIDTRVPFQESLCKQNALTLTELYSTQPARLGLTKAPAPDAVIDALIDALLTQQAEDFSYHFVSSKQTTLPQGLDVFCSGLAPSLTSLVNKKYTRSLAHRHTNALAQLSEKTLSEALALHTCAPDHELSQNDLSAPCLNFPELRDLPLEDAAYRDLIIKKLSTTAVTDTVKGILGTIVPYVPTEIPITPALVALVLQRIASHREKLIAFTWQAPGSFRHNFYYFQQQYKNKLAQGQSLSLFECASLKLLGTKRLQLEAIHPYYTSRELTLAQDQSPAALPALRREINVDHDEPDLGALVSYLNATLLATYDPQRQAAAADTHPYSRYLQLILDLPALHTLAKALQKTPSGTERQASPTASRALAVSAITDYLYPPAQQKLGYICGFNLNSVAMGELPVGQVRQALSKHLKQHFSSSTDAASQQLAFTLLCARYAPELLVANVPAALTYGQTLESVHWRHAVACLEAEQPCASYDVDYLKLVTAYASVQYTTQSEDQKTASALLKQIPVLHFSMCQGVIPQTDIAWVADDDSLTAITYVTEQEALEATTFTNLVQIPPQRKKMASDAFIKANPGFDPEQATLFTEAELKKYFHVHPTLAADRHIGRRMRMTLLEKYMSCVSGVGFTEQELGIRPYPQGACSLQAQFDQKFSTYKGDYLKAMVTRLEFALHGLPDVDRNRILNAYKFIKVSFKNNQGAWEESLFGLIALYKESEEVQFAYEIFCPSGTIRPLPLTAKSPTRINIISSAPTQDALWHESPYLYIPPLDEGAYLRGKPDNKNSAPYLMVSFYTLKRQMRDMSRAQKVKTLSQKMVDMVFSNLMALTYAQLKSPTPYELHKERLFARAQLMASFVLPGYALYQDIKSGTVTLGTVLTAALEIFSLLLPFVGITLKALHISIHLGRVIILSKSLNFSKTALTAAKAIQPLQKNLPNLLLRSLGAANPLGSVALLFQAGHKGILAFKYLLTFSRAEMASALSLSKAIKPRQLPALDYSAIRATDKRINPDTLADNSTRFFRPDTSSTGNHLNIQQQLRLHTSDLDLSDAIAINHMYLNQGKTYIYLQGNIYEIRKISNDTHYQIYKDSNSGAYVKFDNVANRWNLQC